MRIKGVGKIELEVCRWRRSQNGFDGRLRGHFERWMRRVEEIASHGNLTRAWHDFDMHNIALSAKVVIETAHSATLHLYSIARMIY